MSLLRVRGLKKYFGGSGWPRRKPPLKAVDGVDLDLAAGHTLALVGESGCGKSTLARAILRLHEPTGGEVWLDGTPVTGIGRAALRARRREMQIIFQDPYASLNPRRSVGQTLDEPLSVHRWGNRATRQARVNELLEVVGLRPAMANRYPHEFSGGQRQRIGIARALALSPKLIVADEAVSALDVSVQAQILNLLNDIRERFGVGYLFISHDLAVVRHLADRVAVMYLGRIVEEADTADLFRQPRHPYTEALLSAVPVPDPTRHAGRIVLPGDLPSPSAPPSGCPFHPRCPKAVARCSTEVPALRTMDDGARVACHLV
ncbi:MAG: dipeptide ABC transporter ATP-binding protein [Polycyclovorans sp.]|jgi:oligopeptide/dipeptide ABC transporter ATP-binding protein|tara:strand:+ start:9652 stop:10605 length:954 start_codon:yes stop_codon:yes gene_type:complete